MSQGRDYRHKVGDIETKSGNSYGNSAVLQEYLFLAQLSVCSKKRLF
jgi:hypothetical protein